MQAINAIRMGGFDVLPLVEGGKGVAISNGTTAGHWALGGGVGTLSAVNADSYDADGNPIPQLYHAKTRRERHEELIAYAVKGALAQARRAFDITGGKGWPGSIQAACCRCAMRRVSPGSRGGWLRRRVFRQWLARCDSRR